MVALGAADLGLLTSAYLAAFGLAQLPMGIMLDRYGPLPEGRYAAAGYLVAFGVLLAAMCMLDALMVMGER